MMPSEKTEHEKSSLLMRCSAIYADDINLKTITVKSSRDTWVSRLFFYVQLFDDKKR